MGSFSFLCSECEHPIKGNAHSGEHCILFLLEKGEMLEWMQGQYDSYGCVFQAGVVTSQLWETRDWSGYGVRRHLRTVFTLIHNADRHSGIAAYHSGCYPQGPPEVSDSDPEHGDGDFQYTTNGEFRHGTTQRVEPIWRKAE